MATDELSLTQITYCSWLPLGQSYMLRNHLDCVWTFWSLHQF